MALLTGKVNCGNKIANPLYGISEFHNPEKRLFEELQVNPLLSGGFEVRRNGNTILDGVEQWCRQEDLAILLA